MFAQQDLWLKKVTEMFDKVIHEAQSYKMSLEPSSFLAAGITGSKGSLQQTRSEKSSRSRKTSEIQKQEYLKIRLRTLISLRIVKRLTHKV